MKYYACFYSLFDEYCKIYEEGSIKIVHEVDFDKLNKSGLKYAKDIGKAESKLINLLLKKKNKEKSGKSLTEKQVQELEKVLDRVNTLRKKYNSVPWGKHDEAYVLGL